MRIFKRFVVAMVLMSVFAFPAFARAPAAVPTASPNYDIYIFPGTLNARSMTFDQFARAYAPFAAYASKVSGYTIRYVPVTVLSDIRRNLADGKYPLFMGPPQFAAFAIKHGYSIVARGDNTIGAAIVARSTVSHGVLTTMPIIVPIKGSLIDKLAHMTLPTKMKGWTYTTSQDAVAAALQFHIANAGVMSVRLARWFVAHHKGFVIVAKSSHALGYAIIARNNLPAVLSSKLAVALTSEPQSPATSAMIHSLSHALGGLKSFAAVQNNDYSSLSSSNR